MDCIDIDNRQKRLKVELDHFAEIADTVVRPGQDFTLLNIPELGDAFFNEVEERYAACQEEGVMDLISLPVLLSPPLRINLANKLPSYREQDFQIMDVSGNNNKKKRGRKSGSTSKSASNDIDKLRLLVKLTVAALSGNFRIASQLKGITNGKLELVDLTKLDDTFRVLLKRDPCLTAIMSILTVDPPTVKGDAWTTAYFTMFYEDPYLNKTVRSEAILLLWQGFCFHDIEKFEAFARLDDNIKDPRKKECCEKLLLIVKHCFQE